VTWGTTGSGGIVRPALTVAILCLVAYAALGLRVSHQTLGSVDLAALNLAGHELGSASFLSGAGTFPVYATLGVAIAIAGIARRSWLRTAGIAIVALVASWRISDTFKVLFARPRPERWFVHHETSFSYASGHATLALTFYGFWAYVAWKSALPVASRRAIVGLLTVWISAIGWSRLALGAHYATDVAGGYLLGAALLALAIAAAELWRDR
jgi:membrane-associated phospholipid phosphatase